MIKVAVRFTRFPAGRTSGDGPFSGQTFREDIAAPALARGGEVNFDMDGVLGLPSSFLEEAFGGLIRDAVAQGQDASELIARIKIISSEDPFVAEEIHNYMTSAAGQHGA